MKQYGQYECVLRKRATRNLLINHTHLCSSVPSYIPKLFVVQFLQHCCSVASNTLQPHGLQHTGFPVLHHLPELAQTLGVCILSQWCHPTISSSVVPFSSCFQSFLAWGFFPNESSLCIRWPKYWSFSFIISTSNEYSELISFRIDLFDLLAVQGILKSLIQHHSSKASMIWHSAIFMVQISHPYMTTGKTIALPIQTLAGKVMSLLFNRLSRFVKAFLPRSKWYQGDISCKIQK